MAAVRRLEEEGLILCYEVEGRPYIQMQGWGKHQRIRNQRSKFPAPPDPEQAKKGEVTAYELPPREQTAAADCGQLPSIAANGGFYQPIQSQSGFGYESGSETGSESEGESLSPIQSNRIQFNPTQRGAARTVFGAADWTREREFSGFLESLSQKNQQAAGMGSVFAVGRSPAGSADAAECPAGSEEK